MIILDTHIWVWLVNYSDELDKGQRSFLESFEDEGLGVSVISCWEVALLVERGRLEPTNRYLDLSHWIESALRHDGIVTLDLTPEIAVASTQLPGDFHRDPADRMIVATARDHNARLVTADKRIVEYPYVNTIDFR